MIHKVIKRVAIVHNAYGKVSGEEMVIDNLAALLEARGVNVLRFSRSSAEIEEEGWEKSRPFFPAFTILFPEKHSVDS